MSRISKGLGIYHDALALMNMDDFKKRKTPRYQNFDYNSSCVYFITICTQNRRCILSRIVGTGGLDSPRSESPQTVGTGGLGCPRSESPQIVGTGVLDCPKSELTKHGKIADKYIKQLNEFYDHISVEDYVIMPNHIHLLIWVKEKKNAIENGQRTPVPTNIERSNNVCSQFISTFKRFCNKEYGENIWQSRFYDHIIRNRQDYEEHVKYIYENPIRWYFDELYAEE